MSRHAATTTQPATTQPRSATRMAYGSKSSSTRPRIHSGSEGAPAAVSNQANLNRPCDRLVPDAAALRKCRAQMGRWSPLRTDIARLQAGSKHRTSHDRRFPSGLRPDVRRDFRAGLGCSERQRSLALKCRAPVRCDGHGCSCSRSAIRVGLPMALCDLQRLPAPFRGDNAATRKWWNAGASMSTATTTFGSCPVRWSRSKWVAPSEGPSLVSMTA